MLISIIVIVCIGLAVFSYCVYSDLEIKYILKCSRETILNKEKKVLEDEIERLKNYIEYLKNNSEKLFYS